MRKDIKKILEICKLKGVELHNTYNDKLFTSLEGNSEVENIAFAEIILAACDVRNARPTFESDVIHEDWWEIVQDFRPLAQLFAQVNDIAVISWNGHLEAVVVSFIEYKALSENLTVE